MDFLVTLKMEVQQETILMLRNPPKEILSNLHVLIFDLLCLMVGFTMVSNPKSSKTLHPSYWIWLGTTTGPLNNTNVFLSTPFPHPSSAGPFEPSEKILTKTRLESGIWCNSGGHLRRKTSTITTDMVFVCCIFRKWSNNMDADKNKYILTWLHWSDLTNQRYILRELAMKLESYKSRNFLKACRCQWKSGFPHQNSLG